MNDNILKIVNSDLCNSCGACFGVCPHHAIDFVESPGGYYYPKIHEGLCTDCGLCVEVCPGKHFGNTLTSGISDDPFKGEAKDAYVGRAVNKELYENSQSGGIVSAILAHALNKHDIRAAVVVEMQKSDPPRPVVKFVYESKELSLSQKSIYSPIPLLTFMKELESTEDKIAVVGLPCHIHGLMNILDKMPRYKQAIAFTIGLVCDRVMTYAGMDYLLNKAVPDPERAEMIFFRDKRISGYPGDVHVFTDSGKDYRLSSVNRMAIKDTFTPGRCRICFDKMNTYSDLTVCDPHGLNGIDRKNGESAVIVRTERGQGLVRSCLADNGIKIRRVGYEDILNGQGIEKKKIQWRGFTAAWEESGRDVPDYTPKVIDRLPAKAPLNLDAYKAKLDHSFSLDALSLTGELITIADNEIGKKDHKKKKKFLTKIIKPIRKLFIKKTFKIVKREEANMNIEIRKVQFANKGAALMLHAVLDRMRNVYPDAEYVMQPNIRSSYKQRGALGLLQKASYRYHRIQWGAFAALLPSEVRKSYGLVLDKEINVVLDAAGFAYSEQLGKNSCSELARSCRKWKKQNTKIVLLPQAFGPFESTKSKKDMTIVARNADIIFARDKVSYEHLVNAVGHDRNIKMAPDFTNLLQGELPDYFDKVKYNFCIVPNARMLNKVSKELSSKYIPFMVECINYLLEKDQRPFILVHGEKSDVRLAEDIINLIDQDIMILKESDPLKVKGIIGACNGMVGSRYHSLISSLSQEIPALGTSWSHKYQMLYDDYGFPQGLIDIDANEEQIHSGIDMILDPTSNREIRMILNLKSNEMKRSSERMWETVINIVNETANE